jgi:tripartite-type tricarboxylate transporter receptor subunit TctC
MGSMRFGRIAAAAAGVFAVVGFALGPAGPARAEYPEKTVRLVVPYGAGGGIDGFTRVIAQQLGELWGRSVIVENKPGGGTTVGTDMVARSEPDGHMLLMNASSIAINFATYPRLPFRADDLAPITMTARMPMVLVVGSAVPANTMQELIALSKSRPEGVSIGSSGQGGISHLALELLKHRSPLRATHVPYKTTGASVTDVVGGRIDGFFATTAGVVPHIRKGLVKPIAVTSTTRSSFLPEVPTMKESGVPDYEIVSWFGLFGPAGLPAAVADRVHRDMARVLETPEAKRTLESQGLEAAHVPPDEFRRIFRAEIATWTALVKETGLKFD